MLSTSSIDLFFIPVRPLSATEQIYLQGVCHPNEREKAERYRSLAGQDGAMLSRGALRLVLSKYTNIKPNDWMFETSSYGKPQLCHQQFLHSRLRFNVSHSGDWLLIGIIQLEPHMNAAGMGLFGVDIERARAKTDIHPILKHYFTEQETQSLLALPEPLQRDRFFDLWALKESYIKATGFGLAQSLKSFAFDIDRATQDTVELCNAAEFGLQSTLPLMSQVALTHFSHSSISPSVSALSALGVDSREWQSVIGRLDGEYRFAVTVSDCRDNLLLSAQAVSLAELLAK